MSRTNTPPPTPGTPKKTATTHGRVGTIAVEAMALRTLNEQQTAEGLPRLRLRLRALQEKGIIDEKGNLLKKDMPTDIQRESTCDV